MKRTEATTYALGIGHAITHLMKNLTITERPKKICIMFENDVIAHSVEVLLKNNWAPAMIPILDLNNRFEPGQLQPRPRHESWPL